MKISDATPHLISLWLERPEEKRTNNDVLQFFLDLQKQDSPYLSFTCSGDKCQKMKTILRHHIKA